MSNFVLRSYISGVQQYLSDAGYVKYANEAAAEIDNAALAGGLEQQVPAHLAAAGAPEVAFSGDAMATEGMPAELNAPIAKAVAEMAAQAGEEAEVAKAKAAIIENAAVEMAGNQKLASVIVVSGQGKGTVAGQTSESKEEQEASQVDNDASRTAERVAPGTQADEDKGIQGEEKVTPLPKPASAATKVEQEATQIDNDTNRVHPSTAPGTEQDAGKGMMGEEQVREKISSQVGDILSQLNV